MTLGWRALGPGDVDHELLWSSVLIVCGALGWWVLSTAGLPPLLCPFKALTGVPCLTCGAGRAIASLADGEVLAAIRFNPLVPLGVAAGAAYVAYAAFAVGTRRGERIRAGVTLREALVLRWTALAAAAAVWIWLVADGR